MLKWSVDRPSLYHNIVERDLNLAEAVLHHLAVSGPPDSASSPQLGSKDAVSLAPAAKGIGPAGSVPVLSDLWQDWAGPQFEWAGRHAPMQPPSTCPKAAAMLQTLCKEGLLAPTQDPANAQVFVKYKSEEKVAMIVNMVPFNHCCAYKSKPFRLPSLEGLAMSVRQFFGTAWACK